MAVDTVVFKDKKNYILKSGTVKVERIVHTSRGIGYERLLNGRFVSRKDLRKMILEFKGMAIVLTVRFDDPEDEDYGLPADTPDRA